MSSNLAKYFEYFLVLSILLLTTGCNIFSGDKPEEAEYTIMVYAAGDNTLSWQMIADLDEMEKVGSDESMNVVVQTEYNPTTIGQRDDCGPECFNRPNFNTFRYLVQKSGPNSVPGPDGSVEDIGNRDMTSPDELSEFIQWSKNKYPAQKYVLVLANHGGAYSGIFEDETSAGSELMGLDELRSGLVQSNTKFNVITFEACLMGGAETLYTVRDLADYVVFSEKNVVPGALPYTPILSTIKNNSSMSPRRVAKTFVDRYIAYHENGPSSITMSAADMSVFNSFLESWNSFATALAHNTQELASELSSVIPQVTQFEYPVLRDLGHFLELLNQQTKHPALHGIIGEVQSELSGLILEHQSYTSSNMGSVDVRNSQGLSIVLPYGGQENPFPARGTNSFNYYKKLYPSLAWTNFLENWIGDASGIEVIDQQEDSFELTLAWGGQRENASADLDLWVLEPNGNLFIPFLGTLTPTGTFSPSSQESGQPFEQYHTRQFVEKGTYYFFSALWSDPQNIDPYYEITYRFSDDTEFVNLYETHPTLSTEESWYDDSNPTLEEAVDGKYSDLELAATWQAGSQELTPTQSPQQAKIAASQNSLLTPEQKSWLKQATQDHNVQKKIETMRNKRSYTR